MLSALPSEGRGEGTESGPLPPSPARSAPQGAGDPEPSVTLPGLLSGRKKVCPATLTTLPWPHSPPGQQPGRDWSRGKTPIFKHPVTLLSKTQLLLALFLIEGKTEGKKRLVT